MEEQPTQIIPTQLTDGTIIGSDAKFVVNSSKSGQIPSGFPLIGKKKQAKPCY